MIKSPYIIMTEYTAKKKKRGLLFLGMFIILASLLFVYSISLNRNNDRMKLQSLVFDSIIISDALKNETNQLLRSNPIEKDPTPILELKKQLDKNISELLDNPYLETILAREKREELRFGLSNELRGISRELDIVALFYSRKILSGVPGANQEYYDKINSGLLWNELYQLRILLNATLDNNLSEIGRILMGRQQSGFFRLSLLSLISLLILLFAMYSLHIIFLIRSQKKEKRHIEQHSLTLDVIIDTLAYQVELRDNNTGRHIERTSQYVEIITRKLAETQGDETYLTEAYIRDITSSSILHDIGKIGIPDNILLKPGRLSDEEFDVIKLHCSYGADTLRKADEKLPFDSYLTIAIQLAESHHERWDGTGYPYGLRGEEIPLSGRIMTVADVYDAMRSERVYKSALPHEECLAYIREQSGKKFDPRIVDAFVSLESEIKAISLLEEV